MLLRIQSRQTQGISPGTCIRRNGLSLRLQTWSQAPQPGTEKEHKYMEIQVHVRPNQNSLHTLFHPSLTVLRLGLYHPWTGPELSQCYHSSRITLFHCQHNTAGQKLELSMNLWPKSQLSLSHHWVIKKTQKCTAIIAKNIYFSTSKQGSNISLKLQLIFIN